LSRNPLLSIALAEWLRFPLPPDLELPAVARAVRSLAVDQRLHDLKTEQAFIEQRSGAAGSVAEQMQLQRRARDLTSEITELETAVQAVSPKPAPQPEQEAARKQAQEEERQRQREQEAARKQAQEEERQRQEAEEQAKEQAKKQREQEAARKRAQPAVTQPPAPPPQPARPAWVPEMVEVPAGPFLMGSSNQDKMAKDDEKPQHCLELPTYFIGKTPVTNAQFRPFVEGDGYRNADYWTEVGWQWRQQEQIVTPRYWDDSTWNGDEYPIVGISWFEAVAYCRWLATQTGIPFRLPTEAEWEKAARGPEGLIYPWGNRWETGRCISGESLLGRTVPVGSYPNGASPYGALDMAGNVREWCVTKWQKPYPYRLEEEWTEEYLAGADTRIVRGGAWGSAQRFVRGASRPRLYDPRNRFISIGVRLSSRSLPDS
jgi:formylglycine-generating enzyme required for sulfatase activity